MAHIEPLPDSEKVERTTQLFFSVFSGSVGC